MDRQPTLDTERLTIRPMSEADREALFAIASDPMIWEQHPIHDRWRREVFDAFFDEGLASGGALVIQRKIDGAVLGSTRYDRYDPAEGGVVEIGWTYLARDCWGKGINPEMKRAMLAHALADVDGSSSGSAIPTIARALPSKRSVRSGPNATNWASTRASAWSILFTRSHARALPRVRWRGTETVGV